MKLLLLRVFATVETTAFSLSSIWSSLSTRWSVTRGKPWSKSVVSPRWKALLLMQHVAEYLDSISVRHVVCTANRPIRGCLRKLGIRFREIGFANPELLEADQDSWGSYYETAPLVLTGEVRVGIEAIRQLMACFS